jgi:hypothetical protein
MTPMIFAAKGSHDSYNFGKSFSVEGIPDPPSHLQKQKVEAVSDLFND